MTAQISLPAGVLTEAATTLLAAADRIKDLERQLGSARDWAVALEGQNAAALALARYYSCDASGYDEIAAALTGEDA